jgi:hypothetical protein
VEEDRREDDEWEDSKVLSLIPDSQGFLYWEMVADEIKQAGWSVGWVRAYAGKSLLWSVDASKWDGQRFMAQDEELAIAMLALQRMIADAVNPDAADLQDPMSLPIGGNISQCI